MREEKGGDTLMEERRGRSLRKYAMEWEEGFSSAFEARVFSVRFSLVEESTIEKLKWSEREEKRETQFRKSRTLLVAASSRLFGNAPRV
ncbi:hypothetical protein L484_022993 [Morus notabilis]|uniref:Uncharacterized protein n=1 Tax=Morus notabilis TaxID=981085 RepID=W9RKF7_9ROSA|nr:hypothetical protein L484_022993 [Morus notabilis]